MSDNSLAAIKYDTIESKQPALTEPTKQPQKRRQLRGLIATFALVAASIGGYALAYGLLIYFS